MRGAATLEYWEERRIGGPGYVPFDDCREIPLEDAMEKAQRLARRGRRVRVIFSYVIAEAKDVKPGRKRALDLRWT